eukprot:TRINITY_DN1394_c0_g1_i1.p1 TRINITY_DN1394_c0_g1~~TRINITY_DN1394_c0_g1_i1.p1  ORF type:complete len:490 (+),score=141.39 TRINITY_DN1394_c0_g1_i1:52-1521(+)
MSKTGYSPEATPEVFEAPSFTFNWRDLAGWQADGIQFSTSSNEAVKMYDALLHQAIYHYNDGQLGGFGGTTAKMTEADPEFAMGKIFGLGLDCFATNPKKNEEPRKKLIDFSAKAKEQNLTKYEKGHLKAAELLALEDYWGAMVQYQEVLKEYPKDPYALQMAYFLALTIGETPRLYDIPASVVEYYNPSTPFYGHVFGKICFGEGERGNYDASEIAGRKALDHFPLDNWAHHALAHNFEESGRALQGRNFLLNSARDWTTGTTFSHHIWWHTALFHVQLGEYEAALQLYDDKVGPMTLKDGGSFPLSDGSSLLMRLHLEGVDIGNRADEQAKGWVKHNDDFVSLFYDGHNSFCSLLAGDRAANTKLLENMREYVGGDRQGWNKDVTSNVGIPLVEGITHFMDAEYAEAVEKLAPVMPELQKKIQGSKAQKDIFRQILLHAAVKSNTKENIDLAMDILNNRLVEAKLEKHAPLNQRFLDRMVAVHETQG